MKRRLTFLEKQTVKKPNASNGICCALKQADNMGADALYPTFRHWLASEGLDTGFPVEQLRGIAADTVERYSAYMAAAGNWDPDTEIGCMRLTIWGAFWHAYEEGFGNWPHYPLGKPQEKPCDTYSASSSVPSSPPPPRSSQ